MDIEISPLSSPTLVDHLVCDDNVDKLFGDVCTSCAVCPTVHKSKDRRMQATVALAHSVEITGLALLTCGRHRVPPVRSTAEYIPCEGSASGLRARVNLPPLKNDVWVMFDVGPCLHHCDHPSIHPL